MRAQKPYWDWAASQKTFTHPIDREWLQSFVRPTDRILDYGCGYGRVLSELAALGYANALGVDFSPQMIARGEALHPELNLSVIDATPVPEPNGSFDVVLLVAVLTCIPDDGAQEALLGECQRLLLDGGLLLISDMPLQETSQYQRRYERGAEAYGVYGVFKTSDGAVVRHHDEDRIRSWTSGFELLRRRQVDIVTMNGTPCTAVQLLARR